MDISASRTEVGAYLSVPELAKLLKVNEKRVCQLAGSGALPCTKMTGEWVFPRNLIDNWLLESNYVDSTQDRLLLAGSDDRLIKRLCSKAAIDWQRKALISYSPNGAQHGLRMLDQGRIDGCFINWGAEQPDTNYHLDLLRTYKNYEKWVIVRCFNRNQGFIVQHHVIEKNRTGATTDPLSIVGNSVFRWAMRRDDSGTERLLTDYCIANNIPLDSFRVTGAYDSERSAAAAVNTGIADICCGVQSTAFEFGLDYVPLTNVSIDLVLPRHVFIRPLVQELLARMQDSPVNATPVRLDGYNINRSLHVIPFPS